MYLYGLPRKCKAIKYARNIFYNLRILLSTGLMCLRIYNLTQEIKDFLINSYLLIDSKWVGTNERYIHYYHGLRRPWYNKSNYDVIGGRYGPECPGSAYLNKKFTLRVNNVRKHSLILHSANYVQILLLWGGHAGPVWRHSWYTKCWLSRERIE